MKQKNPLPNPFYTHTPWDENINPLWPATAFYLVRNFTQSLFPHKMTESQSIKMIDQLSSIILKLQQLQNPVCLKAEELSAFDKEFLYEHFLCRESFQNTLRGQAFVVDDTAHFLAILNLNDHIEMELIDCKNKWEKAWSILSDIDSAISAELKPSFSPRFGYLSSDPGKCGTALSVVCYLHLPILIQSKQLEETFASQLEDSVLAKSLQGAPDEFIGDFILLQNKFTLGLTEEMILRDLHISATKLSLVEKSLREKLFKEDHLEIKDMVSRSLGLLLHSYQLQTKEVLNALSKIKLGINLGWISGISDNKMNEVFFTCQKAHIGFMYGEPSADFKEIAAKRAEFIHKELKDAKFIDQ
jgi:protein arginine kinase